MDLDRGALGPLSFAQVLVGILLVAYLPGSAWTFVLFDEPSILARSLYSVAISVTSLTLVVYLLNVTLHVEVSAVHTVWTSLLIAGVAASLLLFRWLAARGIARAASPTERGRPPS